MLSLGRQTGGERDRRSDDDDEEDDGEPVSRFTHTLAQNYTHRRDRRRAAVLVAVRLLHRPGSH